MHTHKHTQIQHVCLCSEDSDLWIMGCDEWHSGYSTCSTKKYRHVISGRTRVGYLGNMTIAERIRLAMWTSNDYLPGFKGVGWSKARELHEKYEKLPSSSEKVIIFVYVALTPRNHPLSLSLTHTHTQHEFLLDMAATTKLKASLFKPRSVEEPVCDHTDPYREPTSKDGSTIVWGPEEVGINPDCTRTHSPRVIYLSLTHSRVTISKSFGTPT